MVRLKKQETAITPLPIGLCPSGWLAWLLQAPRQWLCAATAPSRVGIFVAFGRCVWIERQEHASELYKAGFFGKGSLSRSEPTWFERLQNAQWTTVQSPEQITADRRRQRRAERQEKAAIVSDASHMPDTDQLDLWEPPELLDMTGGQDVERLHLDLCEAYFLAFAIGALEIRDPHQNRLSLNDCWTLFSRTYTSPHGFAAHYAAYHYYRSLGWVPKDGAKFGVHLVLYQSGPKYRHAEFAVIVIAGQDDSQNTWRWILGVNRICAQVKKTVVLCHVVIPRNLDQEPPDLEKCQIHEVILKRWSPEKNRD